jgi:hypothetical protein
VPRSKERAAWGQGEKCARSLIEKEQRAEQEEWLKIEVQMDFKILLAKTAANKVQNRPP